MTRPWRARRTLAAAGVGLAIGLASPAGAWADSARPSVHAVPGKRVHHRGRGKTASLGSGVVGLAGCYGRYIAWRDELSGLMLQANSYTPSPDDGVRFDRMERAFAAGARQDRNLVLTLQPSFQESDFPRDIRRAFRAGMTSASNAFADKGYRNTQSAVIGQPGLTPQQRLAQMEANADQAFAPLAVPCEQLTGF
jgi:hypothetical protein